jgi:hypothetical protein
MHLTLHPALAALQIAASTPGALYQLQWGGVPAPTMLELVTRGISNKDHASHWSRIRALAFHVMRDEDLVSERWAVTETGRERGELVAVRRSGRCTGLGQQRRASCWVRRDSATRDAGGVARRHERGAFERVSGEDQRVEEGSRCRSKLLL